VHQVGSEIKNRISVAEVHTHTHMSASCHEGAHDAYSNNRFLSFSPQQEGNDAKWYVDACGYMWAVSKALEEAKESIWILDCKYPSPHEENGQYQQSYRVAVTGAIPQKTTCEKRKVSGR